MARKEMTESEKEAFKRRMANSKVSKKETKHEDDELALLRKQNELLMSQLNELKGAQPQVVQVMATDNQKVHFIWQAEVADDNILWLGEGGRYGRISGKTGEVFVPKSELTNLFDEKIRWYVDNRWLIIKDGLTEEEKEAYNAVYKDGELLDKKTFMKIVEVGDEILDVYPKLCREHQKMIAKRYVEAYQSGADIPRERVVKLNKMSRTAGSKKGDFVSIVEAMNDKDIEEVEED